MSEGMVRVRMARDGREVDMTTRMAALMVTKKKATYALVPSIVQAPQLVKVKRARRQKVSEE